MKKPTRSAPHIWRKVSRNTCPRIAALGRINSNITNQEARMAVSPMKGAKGKATEGTFLLMEKIAFNCTPPPLTFGHRHHGPVHHPTTSTTIQNGKNDPN